MKRVQKGVIPQGDEKTTTNQNVEQIEHDKRKAAYALNLCTVSVSQIIDYEDLNILEQEYEMILNNLNLENFPKDKPLLHILKQILDTVSFFRIYEGDKRMLDKKYQQKMKNAIWSAIPPFTFVAGGNPYALAISAIAAVGMGYMNYRKEKAKISSEKEEDEWKLQRSAIEQFHGLRRELFDTAWRLSEKYGFNDEYRLTEKQISAYNSILMDEKPLRKYERLNAIKDFFVAYPPFWYYFGNAALNVAKKYGKSIYYNSIDNSENQPNYFDLAEQHFKKYLEYDHSLLRTNYIRSSCCLEYAALLLERNDDTSHDKVKQLILDAEKYAPDALDALQICAMYSLRNNDIDVAQRLLRKLVVEGFNTTTNAQLLSYIYLNTAYYNKKLYNKKTAEYIKLVQFTDGSALIPWAEDVSMLNKKGVNIKLKEFLDKQKVRIQNMLNAVVDKIIESCAIDYNKLLFLPLDDSNIGDNSFYTDSETSINQRIKRISAIGKNQIEVFSSHLKHNNIAFVLNNQLNELFWLLSSFVSKVFKTDIDEICKPYLFYYYFESSENQKTISGLMEKVKNDTFDEKDGISLTKNSFTSIMNEYTNEFKKNNIDEIFKRESFNELISIESELIDFCNTHNYPTPEKLCENDVDKTFKENRRQFVNVLNYFSGANDFKKNEETESKLRNEIECFIKSNKLFKDNAIDPQKFEFTTDEVSIRNKRKKFPDNDLESVNQLGNILAYYHDNRDLLNPYIDLYFFREGFLSVEDGSLAKRTLGFFNYRFIEYDPDKQLIYTKRNGVKKDIYNSNKINIRELFDLIVKLRNISTTETKK
ncbi:hypothetical protein SAMN04487851_11024 [Prevotella sp. tc2-28]|uniref:hypothetical protein n=1 Tax=Prevotella sp. tc2-28 TaxID=1761888 RepID=UPI0008981D05|nr:hypothetical protein [Prevotella sp. tc2-28]SEA64522.1 hypothetical protein SAMN04487851_11024 [Prevotella sp. tc2-28]